MRLVGRPDLIQEPWFKSGAERAEHADELDSIVSSWVAQRDEAEVLRAFESADAAVAPIQDAADVLRDPQYQALGSIVCVPDEDLGSIRMPNVLFRMLDTPGRVRWAGRRLGQDNATIYAQLGLDATELDQLRLSGVI